MSQVYTLDNHNRDWKFLDVKYTFNRVPRYMLENIWNTMYFVTRFKMGVESEEFKEREALIRRFLTGMVELELKTSIRKQAEQLLLMCEESSARCMLLKEAGDVFEQAAFITDSLTSKFHEQQAIERFLYSEKLCFDRRKYENLVWKKFVHRMSLVSMQLVSETNRQLLREAQHQKPRTEQPSSRMIMKEDVIDEDFILEELKHLIFYEKRQYQFMSAVGKLLELEVCKTTMGVMGRLKSKSGEIIRFSFHHQCGHQRRVQNTIRNTMTRALRLAGWIE